MSSNVTISGTARYILEIEHAVIDADAQVKEKLQELLRVQQELSILIGRRDSLMEASAALTQQRTMGRRYGYRG